MISLRGGDLTGAVGVWHNGFECKPPKIHWHAVWLDAKIPEANETRIAQPSALAKHPIRQHCCISTIAVSDGLFAFLPAHFSRQPVPSAAACRYSLSPSANGAIESILYDKPSQRPWRLPRNPGTWQRASCPHSRKASSVSAYFMQAWDDQHSHSIDCRRVKSFWVRRRGGAQGDLVASRPNDVGRPRQ